ncbi:phytanoyl-CoA dioxygenase family protein [Micromonospora saelicesensis]|uniref:phytanoyl-CoA dioxygenase family protein n=1 Tax=Micromonospora saelicesensis TaxID=285676 RepID=UPI003D8B48FC
MVDVPAEGIAEVDVAVSGRDGIAAAVESLRSDGVVILRRAVDPALLASVNDMVIDWYSRFLNAAVHNYSLGEESATRIPDLWQDAFTEPRELQGFRKWNIAGLDSRIIPLVDCDPLYGVIHSFIGPDLSVTKTQMLVLPSGCLDSPFLHTDAGSLADIVESPDASPVMVSAQVFLTDLPNSGMGNFTCVPGSHKKRYPWSPDNPTRSQLGGPLGQEIPTDIRRQVTVRAGDIAIFIHSLWHGATSNTSAQARRSVILSYAKSFVRPYDYESTPEPVLQHGTPRQRILFGDLGSWAFRPGCFYHYPEDYLKTLAPDRAGDQ